MRYTTMQMLSILRIVISNYTFMWYKCRHMKHILMHRLNVTAEYESKLKQQAPMCSARRSASLNGAATRTFTRILNTLRRGLINIYYFDCLHMFKVIRIEL
jgi:hypothetical protein